MQQNQVNKQVEKVIRDFLAAQGKECPSLNEKSNLHLDAGLTSDEGVVIIFDLSDALGIRIPDDFNAVVHEGGKRARTLSELAELCAGFAGAAS